MREIGEQLGHELPEEEDEGEELERSVVLTTGGRIAHGMEGLKRLEELHGHKLGAVFSGGDKGNLEFVKKKAEELGLSDRVRFAGFVPEDQMPYLYRQSVALVMPTYFGPTNLPLGRIEFDVRQGRAVLWASIRSASSVRGPPPKTSASRIT